MVVHAILESEVFLVIVGGNEDVAIDLRVGVNLTLRPLQDSLLLRRNVRLLVLKRLIGVILWLVLVNEEYVTRSRV